MLSNNAKKKTKRACPFRECGSKKAAFFQNAEQYMPQHPQKLDLRKQNPVYIPATANFLRLSLIRKKTAFMSAKGEFQEKRGAGMSALLTFRLPLCKTSSLPLRLRVPSGKIRRTAKPIFAKPHSFCAFTLPAPRHTIMTKRFRLNIFHTPADIFEYHRRP